IMTPRTFDGATMARTIDKAARRVGKRIMESIFIGTKWGIGHVNSITVHIEFGTGSSILQVVFIVVFDHRWAFHIPPQHRIGMVFPESFPAMRLPIQVKKFVYLTRGDKTVGPVKFFSPDGKLIGRPPE